MERRAQAAEALLARAKQDERLKYAIQAADLNLKAAAEASSKAVASRLRRRCNELIAYAERLKEVDHPSLTQGEGLALNSKTQRSTHQSTAAAILEASSYLHGHYFPPWSDEPSEADFEATPGVDAFIDDAYFALSETQQENFDSWRRPLDILGKSMSDQVSLEESLMQAPPACDLVQDVTTDCSVVASLSAAVQVLVSPPHSALSSIIYPYNHSFHRPRISASGKYILRLNFNGCYRRVVIDDRLPASKSDRTLFVVDRTQPCLLWPALLEKAYLKVRGGYDFPGSNSGTDLWVLTGWVPEQLFLQRQDFDVDEVWANIKAGFDAQHVVITLGTGRISREEEQAMGLIGEHDYAVQALSDEEGSHQVLLKNPWCNGPLWNVACWPSSASEANVPSSQARSTSRRPAPDGHLWVSWNDIAQNFESLYLNWDPKLFAHRNDLHFTWVIPNGSFANTFVHHPQFTLTCPHACSLLILVSRHFVDGELDIAREKTDSMAALSRRLGFMSILLFDNSGARVQLGGEELYRGPYVDSPQTTARLVARGQQSYTLVLDQHAFPFSKYSFTLSVFSSQAVKVANATERMACIEETLGSWTKNTAGGNARCTTFFRNPQFSIAVQQQGPLSILLSADEADSRVRVDLVWAGGKRAMSVRARDLVTSSGEYRRSCAVAENENVEPGVYTIVCSTFEPGQTGSFALRLSSSHRVQMTPIPNDTAGRLQTPLAPFTLSGREEKRRASISVPRLIRASISAQSTALGIDININCREPSSLMLRVSVVRGWGPDECILAVTGDGDFQEPTTALRTPEFDLDPAQTRREGVWLVIETLGAPHSARCVEGDIFAESTVDVGPWEIVA